MEARQHAVSPPAVMVSAGDKEGRRILTVAWTGTICTNPAMVYISVRRRIFLLNDKGYQKNCH